jgi:hypothetical protein
VPLKIAAGVRLCVALCIEELRRHAGDTAICVLANKSDEKAAY